MIQHESRHILLSLCLFLSTALSLETAEAQNFDPAKVDWEKLSKIPMRDGFIKIFNEQCGACHGDNLRGATLGPALVGVDLRRGDSVKEIAASIASGSPEAGMPAWSETMDETQIWNMALYVAEQRQGTTILEKNNDIALTIPEGAIQTELHKIGRAHV